MCFAIGSPHVWYPGTPGVPTKTRLGSRTRKQRSFEFSPNCFFFHFTPSKKNIKLGLKPRYGRWCVHTLTWVVHPMLCMVAVGTGHGCAPYVVYGIQHIRPVPLAPRGRWWVHGNTLAEEAEVQNLCAPIPSTFEPVKITYPAHTHTHTHTHTRTRARAHTRTRTRTRTHTHTHTHVGVIHDPRNRSPFLLNVHLLLVVPWGWQPNSLSNRWRTRGHIVHQPVWCN